MLTALLLAGIAVGAVAPSKQGIVQRLGLHRGQLSWSRAGWLTVGMLALSESIECAMAALGTERGPVIDALSSAAGEASAPELALLFVTVALVSVLAEELFARGWIQRGLAPRLGGLPALVASALLFGVLHGHPAHAAAAGLLGLWLGWIVHVDGGLRVAFVAHACNNAVAIAGSASLARARGPGGEVSAITAFCDARVATVAVLVLLGTIALEARAATRVRNARNREKPAELRPCG